MSVPTPKIIDFSDPKSESWAFFARVLIEQPIQAYYEKGAVYEGFSTNLDVVRVKRKLGKPQDQLEDRFEVLEPTKFGDGVIADTRRSLMTLILKDGVLIQHKTYALPEGARRIFKTQKLEHAEREYEALQLVMPESIKPLVKWKDKATIGIRFFHGPSLYTLLGQPMTEEEAIAYSIQILKAFDENVLKFGLTFRDVKPNHFLLTKEGKFRVIDYGFAVKDTFVQGKAGSPYYMSPESWGLGSRLGPYSTRASDRFSIGVMLSEVWGGLLTEDDKARYKAWKSQHPKLRREFPNLMTRFAYHPENKIVVKTLIDGLTENDKDARLHLSSVQKQFRRLEYHYSIDVLNLTPKTSKALRQLIKSDPGRVWQHGVHHLSFIPGPNKPVITRHFTLIQSLQPTEDPDKHYRVLSSTGEILDTLRHSDFQLTERVNLRKLQETIEKTRWNVGFQLRKTIIETKEKGKLIVPNHVKQIWDLNHQVLSKTQTTIRELRDTESKVLTLGQKAASRFSLFRKKPTQAFYQTFKAAKDFNSLVQGV